MDHGEGFVVGMSDRIAPPQTYPLKNCKARIVLGTIKAAMMRKTMHAIPKETGKVKNNTSDPHMRNKLTTKASMPKPIIRNRYARPAPQPEAIRWTPFPCLTNELESSRR